MTALVEVETSYAGDDKLQQVIIECLDDEDRTIGKKVVTVCDFHVMCKHKKVLRLDLKRNPF